MPGKPSTILSIIVISSLLLLTVTAVTTVILLDASNNDPRLINESGIIRGSMQRITKLAMHGGPYRQPLKRLQRLLSTQPVEPEENTDRNTRLYFELRKDLNTLWGDLIIRFEKIKRSGTRPQNKLIQVILTESEQCWELANRMVYHAQLVSESRLQKVRWFLPLFLGNVLLLLILLAQIRRYVHHRLEWMAVHDPLTELHNRRIFNKEIDLALLKLQKTKTPFSLAVFDLDCFKQVNDRYGHDTGDEVLRRFSELLKQHTRTADRVCRIGGEEFALILPATDEPAAVKTAEKIRELTSGMTFSSGLTVTVSGGVSEAHPKDDLTALFKRADQALYNSKKSGRNLISSASHF